MGGRLQDRGPATTSETQTRFEAAPAPDNEPGKSKSAKRKKNRNRKRRNRQESFLTPAKEESHRPASGSGSGGVRGDSMEGDRPTSKDNSSFFKLGRNLSNTSLESDALLDHRYVAFVVGWDGNPGDLLVFFLTSCVTEQGPADDATPSR
jgi:magnesium transporter